MTHGTPARARSGARRHPVQLAAAAVGAVFLLVGILGFVPGVTANYGQLTLAGHESGALLLALFAVSILHNLVHAAFGVVGLIMSRARPGARNFLIFGGIVYAVLWIYGLIIDQGSAANFVPINTPDNWLHLVLAIGMVALGVLLGRDTDARTSI
jgi:arginine exporter protein ArgO